MSNRQAGRRAATALLATAHAWHIDLSSICFSQLYTMVHAEAAPSPTLAVIHVATSLTTSLALWGTYITDFVADVAGENTDDAFEEEMAAAQKQK